MYIYQIELKNGKSVKIEAVRHEETDEDSLVLYGQDDEVVGRYKNVDSWGRQKMKEVKIFSV